MRKPKRCSISVSGEVYNKAQSVAESNGLTLSGWVASLLDEMPDAAELERIKAMPVPAEPSPSCLVALPRQLADGFERYGKLQGYGTIAAYELALHKLTRREP